MKKYGWHDIMNCFIDEIEIAFKNIENIENVEENNKETKENPLHDAINKFYQLKSKYEDDYEKEKMFEDLLRDKNAGSTGTFPLVTSRKVKNYLEEDSLSLDVREAKFDKDSKNLLKRRYLFALNYATNNADKEIAAYIGLYEISNVNPKLLDTLYSKMSENVKNSTYGVEFNKFLSSLKEDKKE